MEINGVAHIFVTAGDFERSKAFYMQLLPFLGLKEVMNAAGGLLLRRRPDRLCGARARRPSTPGERFVQNRVGLHHVCFRVRERDEVDEVPRLPGLDRGARSCIRRRTTTTRPATTRCCSRTRTACGWRSTTCPARAC